jgi:hypothetical protein
MSENKTPTHENSFLTRFEAEFRKIMDEINTYSSVIPQYKTENESLRERIDNIRAWAEAASKLRYMPDADADAVLANLITHILAESDNLSELKPAAPSKQELRNTSNELFQMLSNSRNVEIDEAFKGFDFFEENPYKRAAEKKIAKIKRKSR